MILQDNNKVNIELKETNFMFDGELNIELVERFSEHVENTDADIVNLYYDCPGGIVSMIYVMKDMVENFEKFFKIKIVGSVMSAGYGILHLIKDLPNVQVEVIYESSTFMMHDSDISLSKRDLTNKHTLSNYIITQNKWDKMWKSYHEDVLTQEELDDFGKGNDIFIDNERMREYFGIADKKLARVSMINKIKDYYCSEIPTEKCDCEFEQSEIEENRVRGFEFVETPVHSNSMATIPMRTTENSAGYDVVSPIRVELKPGESNIIMTDIKAYMPSNEYVELHLRSSAGIKKNLRLKNGTGVIDSDYYSNEQNDGNIGVPIKNEGSDVVIIEAGERIAQLIFTTYLTVDNDEAEGKRVGGIGSTGKQ